MNDFYKQDIFFFITTIAVVVLTVVAIVVGIYVIKILKDVKYISRKARTETDMLSEDLKELRYEIRKEGFKFKHLIEFFHNMFKKRHGKSQVEK